LAALARIAGRLAVAAFPGTRFLTRRIRRKTRRSNALLQGRTIVAVPVLAIEEGEAQMSTKPLDRLMFAQGGLCFFCEKPLPKSDASVEHLVASANGGSNDDENCVVCCKSLNALLGSMSLKEKVRVVLKQHGQFKCPNDDGAPKVARRAPHTPQLPNERLTRIVNDLRKRGSARPRTLKTLASTVGALFQKKLSEHEISSLIEGLRAQGMVLVSGAKVSYELPEESA
jgi:5-methylcytosine-specific restriction endonuclease McrA